MAPPWRVGVTVCQSRAAETGEAREIAGERSGIGLAPPSPVRTWPGEWALSFLVMLLALRATFAAVEDPVVRSPPSDSRVPLHRERPGRLLSPSSPQPPLRARTKV